MQWAIVIVVLSQIIFTASDFLARKNMSHFGFTPQAFFSSWFIIYFLIRLIAMVGQLFIFSTVQLGRTSALFGATSIILSNFLGFFVLRETLSPTAYFGVAFAVIGFFLLAIG